MKAFQLLVMPDKRFWQTLRKMSRKDLMNLGARSTKVCTRMQNITLEYPQKTINEWAAEVDIPKCVCCGKHHTPVAHGD